MSIVPVPNSISSFSDALGIAFELSDEFAFVHAVAVIDASHQCVDFKVFTRITQTLPDILTWLSMRSRRYQPGHRVLLLSIRSIDAVVVAERDLADYRFASNTISSMGATLLDWIETDGEAIRSFAYIMNPNTSWSAQAVAEGALDSSDW